MVSFIFKLNIIQVYLNISPLWVFSVLIGTGVILYYLILELKTGFSSKNKKRIAAYSILLFGILFSLSINWEKVYSPVPIQASMVLSKYKGKSFVTKTVLQQAT